MKTLLLRLCASGLLACVLTACPETTVGDDFGLKPVVLSADDWNGAWVPVDDDDSIQFTVTDAAQGILRMTEPGKKDDKPVEFRLRRATSDKDVKLYFLIMREQNDKSAATSLHLIREADEDVILAWLINHQTVEAAIKSGQLKGSISAAALSFMVQLPRDIML
jgi:hypothetical protein